jgi:uncharacterized protein (TIGR02646 family)
MIKIEKDISVIPVSLELPFEEFFPNGIPSPPKTTHERRMEIIKNKSYIDNRKYNDRYKLEDARIALKNIYNNKCAYCEQRIEQSHIEHYRPKKIYYWLAFSWDNLILACPTCNQNKGINFDIDGTSIEFQDSDANIRSIHNSGTNYDLIELPKMVNPETTNPLENIRFHKSGLIQSSDTRIAYTIEKCKIDRPDLNDQRRTLLNSFQEDIRSVLLENKDPNDQKVGISTIVSKFIRDSNNLSSPFLAFKRFSISSGWLNEIIKEMN